MMISVILWVLVGGALVAADQITKYLAVKFLMGQGTIEVIDGIVEFYYTTNTGAAFSSFAGQRALLVIMPIVMIAVLIFFFIKTPKKDFLLKLSLTMIISGGIGNLIDRIFNGYVVDFINFAFIEFPIFNVADIFVTCGGVILIIYLIFFSDKDRTGEKNE